MAAMARLRRWIPPSLGRNFSRLWAAQTTSALGSRLTRTALPVLAVLTIEASPTELGILAALSTAPGAVVGLLSGGAIDRTRKRRLLIAADLARLLLLLTIPLAAWSGWLSMGQLYVVAAIAGCATTLFQIADNTYLPALVKREQLVAANTRLESTEAVAEIVGPGLAGILIEIITAPLTIVIDALTYLVSAIMLSRIDIDESLPAARDKRSLLASIARDIAEGAAAVWSVPMVRSIFLVEAVMSLYGGFFFALYMLFTLDTLDLPAGVVGIIISMGGVGALFGAAIVARLPRSRRAAPVLFVLLSLALVGEMLIPLASGELWLVLALLLSHQLIGDGFGAAFHIIAVSLRQALIPPDRLGRANAFFQATMSGLTPIGALVAGALAAVIGVREAIWVGVVIGFTAPLLLVPRLRSAVVTIAATSVTDAEGGEPQ